MVYSDEDNEMSLYEKENLKYWKGRYMEKYTCKVCKKDSFTANLKLSISKTCQNCGSSELEHDPKWRAKR